MTLIIAGFSNLTIVRASVWDNEISLWDDALYKGVRVPGLYNDLGLRYLEKRMPDAAFALFSKGVDLAERQKKPGLANRIRCNRGKAFFWLGDYSRAKREFEKVLTIDHNFGDAYYGLAMIYDHYGENEKALQSLEKYIDLFAKSKSSLVHKQMLQDAKELAERLRRTMEIRPQVQLN